jgi:hypothetical protein
METEGQIVTAALRKNLQEKLMHRAPQRSESLAAANAIYDVQEAYHFCKSKISINLTGYRKAGFVKK